MSDPSLDPDDLWVALRIDLVTELDVALRSMSSRRHAEVLARRAGLMGFQPQTLEDVGRALGVTRARAQQLEMKAYPRLRRALSSAPASKSSITAIRSIIAVGTERWENRVIALAHVLLPRAPTTVGRRLVLLLVDSAVSKDIGIDVVDDPRRAQVSEAASHRLVTTTVTSDERNAAPIASGDGLSLKEAVRERFGLVPNGGPARFGSHRGWFHVGQVLADCPECGLVMEGFRCPYLSAGRRYHYWALVCAKCRTAREPAELGDDVRRSLYQASELRPQPVDDDRQGHSASVEPAARRTSESEETSVPRDAVQDPEPRTSQSADERRAKTLQRRPSAWTPWSAEEDDQLSNEFRAGMRVNEIASTHGRTQNAIRSRLEKLGLR